jgi:hypothetical protein
MLVSLTAGGARVVQTSRAQIVGKANTLWCLVHLLQLAVRDVVNTDGYPYKSDTALVREWVKELRSHNDLREKLAEYLTAKGKKAVQLALDVETR